MYIYVYMTCVLCIYVHMCIRTDTCPYMYTYVAILRYISECVWTYLYMCICVYM